MIENLVVLSELTATIKIDALSINFDETQLPGTARLGKVPELTYPKQLEDEPYMLDPRTYDETTCNAHPQPTPPCHFRREEEGEWY